MEGDGRQTGKQRTEMILYRQYQFPRRTVNMCFKHILIKIKFKARHGGTYL